MTAATLIIAVIGIGLVFLWGKKQQDLASEAQKNLQKVEEASRLQAEQLEINSDREQQLVQNANDALFIFDQEDGSLLEINRQAEDILGYTQGEVTNLTFKVLFSREHRQRHKRWQCRNQRHQVPSQGWESVHWRGQGTQRPHR
jgi:PAS domain S-box-containing protein